MRTARTKRRRSAATILRELRKSASYRAKRRGHLLGRFKTSEGAQAGVFYHAHCQQCPRAAVVNVIEEHAAGSALRERCPWRI